MPATQQSKPRPVIYAEWSDINPRSVCFSYQDIPNAKEISHFSFPLYREDLDRLTAVVGQEGVELVTQLQHVNLASGVIFSAEHHWVTVLGPNDPSGRGKLKREFIYEVVGVICRIYGIDRDSVEVISQRLVSHSGRN